MKYAFERLSEDDFEKLVVCICQHELGIGIHSFSKGRDGGRDGYFSGMATSYPSPTEPWSGRFIIQAKHVTKTTATCSDKDFFENQSSIVNGEIKRMNDRTIIDPFDCYLLFTNRQMSGDAHRKIVQYLQSKLDRQNVDLFGYDDLERYVDYYPELISQFNLFRYMIPNRFYEKDIRDVIVLFSKKSDRWVYPDEDNSDNDSLDYSEKEKKNKLNKVSDVYFEEIKSHSLAYFTDIDKFLCDPRNREYTIKYRNAIGDVRGYIQKNVELHSFVEILESIIELIVGNDDSKDVHRVRALVRVFVHYMYWNCDIGRKS